MAQASRREGFLIEPYKQLRFGITFLIINLIFSSLILLVFGYFIADIYQAQAIYFQLNETQSSEILSKLNKPVIIGAGLVVLFILTTLIASARYTHQFYGPLVSIRRFLDEMLSGHTPDPIQLRASDQLKDLAERLNGLTSHLDLPQKVSVAEIESFLDDLVDGRQPKALSLGANDPLKGIAEKLQILANKTRKI